MKIVLTGGGTGGHITPLLAVAEQLKQLEPTCHIVYVGERHGAFDDLTRDNQLFDEVRLVSAGKFRRYHSTKWYEKLLDVQTIALNIRDVFRVVAGCVQAWFLLRKLRADVVFLKGGYVGVPVGLAAASHHVPIVTHDSDAIPGLANRLVGRWAAKHAVALAADKYPYTPEKTVEVGVLVEAAYQPVTDALKATYRRELGLPKDALVLLVTGGSSGAVTINTALSQIAERLLENYPQLQVVHQVGKGKADACGSFNHERLHVTEFLRPMASYMGAADVVVCRGSANTIAELAVQGKAAVVVPSPYLANGHQLKNAEILAEQGSAAVVQEADLYDPEQGLEAVIRRLFDDADARNRLARELHKSAPRDAAKRVATVLIDEVNR